MSKVATGQLSLHYVPRGFFDMIPGEEAVHVSEKLGTWWTKNLQMKDGQKIVRLMVYCDDPPCTPSPQPSP